MRYILLLLLFPLLSNSQDSLFTAADKPGSFFDDGPLEMGTLFKVSKAGVLTHVRFYAPNAATYVISLWGADHQKIGTQPFTSITGWNRIKLNEVYPLSPNVNYMVSIFSAARYGSRNNVFANPVVKGSLTGIAGRFVYGNGGYPERDYRYSSYYIDPVVSYPAVEPPIPAALVVNAGKDTTLPYLTDSIRLKGSVGGDGVSFKWTCLEDSTLISNLLTPLFTNLKSNYYTFVLTATDSHGRSASSSIVITLIKPVAILLSDGKWIIPGGNIILDPNPVETEEP